MHVIVKLNKGAAETLLILFLLVSVGFYMFLMPMIRSQSDEEITTSNVTVTKAVAISLSGNLTAGITFGSVSPGTDNVNATYNWNSTVNVTWNNQTLYWVTIDSSTNTFIDICTRTNANLTSGSYWVPNSGYTWNSSTTNNATLPVWPPTTAFTSDFNYDTTNLIVDNQDSGTYYIRYALDIPQLQQAGTYNNTVYIRGQENSTSCGS